MEPPAPSILRVAPGPCALPGGMRDLLPEEALGRRYLARAVREVFASHGYRPVLLPAYELEEVVTRGLGPGAQGELLRFLDPESGEVLVLRPDMTPQVARLVASRLKGLPPPVRLSYEGSVVRRTRGRTRRHRQLAQAGIECLGHPRPEADAEVLVTMARALRAAGLGAFTVELSHARLVTACLEAVPEGLREPVADALGARDEAVWRALLRGHPEASGGLSRLASLAGDRAVLAEARRALPEALHPALETLETIAGAALLREPSLDLRVDLGEARGQGYYTGALFQFLVEGAGEPVATGGRYDDLLGRYGHPLAATGSALRLDVLEGCLGAREAPGGERRALVWGASPARGALADRLRASGLEVAELDTLDEATARGYARAHGIARVESSWGATIAAEKGAEDASVGGGRSPVGG
ncbi:MAG: ATP phosphoribosyltransferase regulatory subunit [Deltaproteobacteria bacterium]|nr:ATP phosphoribosyltransferase regulatory subunit [Deltaproteobacteria bacterium]